MQTGGDNTFRLEGEYWTIAYDGVVFRLRDTKGLRHLAYLLGHPETRVPAYTLLWATQAPGALPSANGDGAAAAAPPADAVGPTASAYRRRIEHLQQELEGSPRPDAATALVLRQEIDFLAGKLAALARVGRTEVAVERARLAVTKGIKSALEKIRANHPALERHLAATVRRGYFCSYTPDPRSTVRWRT